MRSSKRVQALEEIRKPTRGEGFDESPSSRGDKEADKRRVVSIKSKFQRRQAN